MKVLEHDMTYSEVTDEHNIEVNESSTPYYQESSYDSIHEIESSFTIMAVTDSYVENSATEITIDSALTYRYINYIPGLEMELKKPIEVKSHNENDMFYIECDELNIYVDGDTPDEVLTEFYNFFIEDFSNWIDEDDKDLTQDALMLKQKYLEYVNIK